MEKGNMLTTFIDGVKAVGKSVAEGFKTFFSNFTKGDIITKISYFIMGFGCLARKQIVKGLLYLGVQIAYLYYMLQTGAYYISMLATLGTQSQGEVWDEELQIFKVVQGDNSMLLLLFGVISVCITIGFLMVYVMNTKTAYNNQCLLKEGTRSARF